MDANGKMTDTTANFRLSVCFCLCAFDEMPRAAASKGIASVNVNPKCWVFNLSCYNLFNFYKKGTFLVVNNYFYALLK